jgi:glycosyltransferase involved in cell wall biosynthesis
LAGRLRRLLEEFRPTIVHTNGIKAHLLVGLGGRPGAAVVWHVRDFLGDRRLVGRALRWAARGADHAIAISEAVARDARGVLGRLPVTTVPNAIDVERFAPGPVEGGVLDRLAGLALPAGAVVRVGLVATYARWKGHEVFLEAIARCPLELPARFYVIGGPIYETAGSQFSEAELRGLADRLGVGDRVGFVPFQADPVAIYRALDVVVHASVRPEPFGRTIIEGMACGKAVVVARGGGALELFTEGIDAVGVSPGDAAGLARVLGELVTDPARRAELGIQARRTAVARYGRARLGRAVAEVYRVVLGGVRSRS